MFTYLTEGEVVDTYGGDYTYRDIWYETEIEEGVEVIRFYEKCYGAKPSNTEEITDPQEIENLKLLM